MNNRDGAYDTDRAIEICVSELVQILKNLGSQNIYVKKLAPNDNSKNQPYFGSHLTDLSFLPTQELHASKSDSTKTKGDKRKVKFTAPLNFSWVDPEGRTYKAPNAKLIYYPQYPEVRFSGFLLSSKINFGDWMDPTKRGRFENRWLIFSVCDSEIFGYLAISDSQLSRELSNTDLVKIDNVFSKIDFPYASTGTSNAKDILLEKLLEIHQIGWIPSQKFSANGNISAYKARNGGGYTLESKLGISPNGIAEPDYLGWEVKQFGVKQFPKVGAGVTTLMTPEPDGGIYREQGAEYFVRNFGYADKNGKPNRMNFGGAHAANTQNGSTGLKLSLIGFDSSTGKMTDATGVIALLDSDNQVAASWSFAKLMSHWKRKHSQAVYIPSLKRLNKATGLVEYLYGSNIEMGIGTNFELFLSAMNSCNIYYDPGIKLEKINEPKPVTKKRSQFRIRHNNLHNLYNNFDLIDIALKQH